MRYFLILFAIIVLHIACFAVCEPQTCNLHSTFNPDLIQMENMFRHEFSDTTVRVAYTKVPRGLIVSIADEDIFCKNSIQIKPSGYGILNRVALVLEKFTNRCVIEVHSETNFCPNSLYKEDWEIAIPRANRIAEYLVRCGKISPYRIFPLGYGNIMPYRENVSRKGFSDDRVDFVIIDYEQRR